MARNGEEAMPKVNLFILQLWSRLVSGSLDLWISALAEIQLFDQALINQAGC